MSDYSEVFGREPETWRTPLGALRLTLAGDPESVDVKRAQHEVEELVKVLNEVSSDPAEVITMRDELAQTIYDLLNLSFQQGEKWLETADGSGNRQSYWLADALIKFGWVVAPPKNEGENNG